VRALGTGDAAADGLDYARELAPQDRGPGPDEPGEESPFTAGRSI
jgi:hypothetical protein